MIKKLLLMALVALPLCVSAQSVKIGLVDTNELINKMPETAAAQNTLNEAQKKYQAEFQKIDEEFQKQYEEFNNMAQDELPAIKERKARQLQETQQKAEAFQQSAMQDLQNQHDTLMAPVVQKVRGAIESVGKENGFSLIQDVNNALFFAAPVEDITPLVKKKLGLN